MQKSLAKFLSLKKQLCNVDFFSGIHFLYTIATKHAASVAKPFSKELLVFSLLESKKEKGNWERGSGGSRVSSLRVGESRL